MKVKANAFDKLFVYDCILREFTSTNSRILEFGTQFKYLARSIVGDPQGRSIFQIARKITPIHTLKNEKTN